MALVADASAFTARRRKHVEMGYAAQFEQAMGGRVTELS